MAMAMLHDMRLTKLVAAAAGEVAADCLSLNLGTGLAMTIWGLGVLLGAALILHLARERHLPRAYWMAVAFNSVAAALLVPALWSMEMM